MISHPKLFSIKACCCLGFCVALALVSFIFPARASAQTALLTQRAGKPVKEPTLQLDVGFDGDARLDYWTPASITLQNEGPAFTGVLSATTYSGQTRFSTAVASVLPWRYSEQVHLPHGARKQVNILVPFYECPCEPAGVIATLSDSSGKVVATQHTSPFTVDLASMLIGVLSDQPAQSVGFSPLNDVTPPEMNRAFYLVSLDATTFPDSAETLSSFDMLVLDEFDTRSLDAAQLTALQTWVNRGGSLVEVGGADVQRTLGALPPQLLPVVINGTDSLPAGTNLLPPGGPSIADTGQPPGPGQLNQAVPISAAALPAPGDARRQAFSSIMTVLTSASTPLIVQAHQGQGNIFYLAFDPASAPLANWPGALAIWKGLLLRGLGDQWLLPANPRYSSGPGALNLRGGLFQVLQPGTLFSAWILVFLAFGYILLLGPLRFLLLKWLKRPLWSWRIVLGTIVVFSLLTYGLASYQKGASYDSISLIQVNQNGRQAHVITYFDVFNPGQGAITLQFPSRILAQPIAIQPFQLDDRVNGDNPHYHINFTFGQDGTSLNLPDAGTWTLNPIVSESDQAVSGGIQSRLAIRGGSLVGTLTNTLPTSLSDVYVLVAHSYVFVGQLPAGQSVQVRAPLRSVPPGSTFADQIARDNHLSVPYFPYAKDAQPKSDFQRHLAMLTALSGEGYAYQPCGGPCSTFASVNEHVITAQPFGVTQLKPLDASDPLQISGASATLIGWAGQAGSDVNATDNATIGGSGIRGSHDDLFQVPLTIGLSGLQNLPAGLISGQVVNVQGDVNNNAQVVAPGIYGLPKGSITFEMALPAMRGIQAGAINNLEVVEPTLNPPSGVTGTGAMQVRMYNWITNAWNTVSLNNDTFITSNTKNYLSADGRVLMQVINKDPSQGILFLEKPSLNLNVATG